MAAAGKLADEAAPEGLCDTLVDLGRLYDLTNENKDEL